MEILKDFMFAVFLANVGIIAAIAMLMLIVAGFSKMAPAKPEQPNINELCPTHLPNLGYERVKLDNGNAGYIIKCAE